MADNVIDIKVYNPTIISKINLHAWNCSLLVYPICVVVSAEATHIGDSYHPVRISRSMQMAVVKISGTGLNEKIPSHRIKAHIRLD
jgi:hypothetical protein